MGNQTSSVPNHCFHIQSEIIADQDSQIQTQENLEEDQFFDEIYFGQESLFQVPQEDMNQILHKNIVAIIGQCSNGTIRGSGILISSNLVLTCAHNMFSSVGDRETTTKIKIKEQCFKIYPGQYGKMIKSYRIQQCFIPEQYRRIRNPQKSLVYDYALIKLSEKVESDNFLTVLAGVTVQDQMQIAIFGYPATAYKQCGKTQSLFSVAQKGLIRKKCITKIKQRQGQIQHKMSTQKGQSGSPIILIDGEDLTSKQSMKVFGIHKGGSQKKKINFGRLITKQLLEILISEAQKLGAQPFSYQIKRESINLNPDENDLNNLEEKDLNKRAKQLFFKKQYKEALKYYNQSLTLNPLNSITYNNIGIVFQEMNKIQNAIKSFQQALKLNPKQTSSLNNLGAAYSRMGKIKEAESCYRKAFDINPYNATAYNSLGVLLASQSNFQQAIRCYEASLNINSNLYLTYFYLGYALSKLGKFDDAIKNYQKSAKINPDYLSCHYYMGLIYCNNKNQYDKAERAFEKCIDIDKHHESAIRLLRRLRNRDKV